MKENRLLEAIGYVDENLLEEKKHMPRRFLRMAAAVALLIALVISAGAAGRMTVFSESIAMGNVTTAQGRFAYGGGYFYCGTERGIFRLNMQTGRVRRIRLPEGVEDVRFLVLTDQGIGFVTDKNEFMILSENGAAVVPLPRDGYLSNVFVQGRFLYTNDGAEFCCINIDSGEKQVLLSNVHSYYVDGERIYALSSGNGFYRKDGENAEFVWEKLSFHPAMVMVSGEVLYFTRFVGNGTYRIIRYEAGVETLLPITGINMLPIGEQLLYLDGQILKCYDPGEDASRVIAENVYEYAVINGTVCVYHYGGSITIGDRSFHFGRAGA